jgi:hypothetical protein
VRTLLRQPAAGAALRFARERRLGGIRSLGGFLGRPFGEFVRLAHGFEPRLDAAHPLLGGRNGGATFVGAQTQLRGERRGLQPFGDRSTARHPDHLQSSSDYGSTVNKNCRIAAISSAQTACGMG